MSKESKDFGVCKKCENMGHVFCMLIDEINGRNADSFDLSPASRRALNIHGRFVYQNRVPACRRLRKETGVIPPVAALKINVEVSHGRRVAAQKFELDALAGE